MSNTKAVHLTGKVPFDWVTKMGEADAAFVARMLLGVATGLRITYEAEWYVPNAHGGRTAMFAFEIAGIEAVSHDALKRLIEAIRRAGGTIGGGYIDLDAQEQVALW